MHGLTAGTARTARPLTRLGWWIACVLSTLVALYALTYVVLGERVFVPDLADSFRARPWGIYTHAFAAALALGLGPVQFHRGVRTRRPRLHRRMGKTYVVTALVVGASGLYMALYSFGGTVTHLGFGALAVAVIGTTVQAYRRIRAGDVEAHRAWMTRSFALMFAAVTLRLWLPVLIVAHGGAFEPAYQWVAWLAWVPNVLWAEWYVRRTARRGLRVAVLG